MKNFLWVLLGMVIGVGGFYFVTKTSLSGPIKPNSSTNIAMMFKSAVEANSLSSTQELMAPPQKHNFTAADLKTLRQYIGVGKSAESDASFDNYEVITYGTNKSITLWLVAPSNTTNHLWQIQKITEGATVTNSH